MFLYNKTKSNEPALTEYTVMYSYDANNDECVVPTTNANIRTIQNELVSNMVLLLVFAWICVL